MRPVNLLPAKNRPHQTSDARSGASYIILGVLAVMLAAVVTYVLETNKITQGNNDIAVAEQKTAEARAKAQQLGPFGDFAQIKEQRVASVKQLANGRFDWERSIREVAHVLPAGVWLQDFQASVAGGDGATETTGTTTGAAAASPTMVLHGCAQKQPQVATALVRLRELELVKDVVLKDSARQLDAGAVTTDNAAESGGVCGAHNGEPNYEFNVVVQFEPTHVVSDTDKGSKVPVRLGGGS